VKIARFCICAGRIHCGVKLVWSVYVCPCQVKVTSIVTV
jgi:hypothetical protein